MHGDICGSQRDDLFEAFPEETKAEQPITTETQKEKKRITIFTIGDSTMADKAIDSNKQERGWAMMLQGFFPKGVDVDNHALNGYSSKSFIDNGKWQAVLDKLQAGDYVIIQFGHNDEKANPARHTDPGSTFDDNLRKFVNETRAKGATPILMNSIVRRKFYQDANAVAADDNRVSELKKVTEGDTLIDTHGQYIVAPRIVANRLHVPFVDANRITHDIEQGAGVIGSRRLHMWFKPGEHPSVPQGRKDNTHYNIYGGTVVAALLADEIARQVPALKKFIDQKKIKKIKKSLK